MSLPERIVVAGAGLAGLRAAEQLRELGFAGDLVIVGAESHEPYHRPALSKGLLNGTLRPEGLRLARYQVLGAKWRLNTSAVHLQPRRRVLHLPGGEEISYDGLIIATGVDARRIAGVPYHDSRVVVLRTLSDALGLERALAANRGPVAIVGSGFTGCEIAASLRELDRDVTIIGRSETLLGNVVGAGLGGWLTKLHVEHGVDVALRTSVRHWVPKSTGIELHLSDNTMLLAACVVVATGTLPATTWLRGSGLSGGDGVVCGPTCHVAGFGDMVSAGDVACWPNQRFDTVPRRVEHWLNAVEMGRAAAESLLAGKESAKPFTPIPRFWSEQYGVRIQAAGIPKLGTDTITLSPAHGAEGPVTGYLRNGRLVGVVGLNCPAAMLTWTEEVNRQNPRPISHRRPMMSGQNTDQMVKAPVPSTRFEPTRNESDWFQPESTVPYRNGAKLAAFFQKNT